MGANLNSWHGNQSLQLCQRSTQLPSRPSWSQQEKLWSALHPSHDGFSRHSFGTLVGKPPKAFNSHRFWGHPGNTEWGFIPWERYCRRPAQRLVVWRRAQKMSGCLESNGGIARSEARPRSRYKELFRSPRSVSTKDKSNEAIRLFWKHESYFHFLLSTEIW